SAATAQAASRRYRSQGPRQCHASPHLRTDGTRHGVPTGRPRDGYGPAGEQLTSLPPEDRRGATGDLAGAVLRPGLRVRSDAAQPPAAAPPDAARRPADAVPAAGRVVGLDLHDL